MNHRWERLRVPILPSWKAVGRDTHNDFSLCIRCGLIKWIERLTGQRAGRYNIPRVVFYRTDQIKGKKTPLCDGVWPEDWKPKRQYSMFLDDIRNPPAKKGVSKNPTWIVVRSFDEAVAYVERHGIPAQISFDHDLGDNIPTGHDFAKWLVERHLDETDLFPSNFSYIVHSANPPGAANIKGLLDNFLQFFAIQNRDDGIDC